MRRTSARDDRAVINKQSEETLWLKRLSSVEPNKIYVCAVCVVYVHVSMCVNMQIHKCYCVTTAQFIEGE